MITFSKLEKKGHLGNQLFQIASTIGIAIENQQQFGFPKWSHSDYFRNSLPIKVDHCFIVYDEKNYHYEFPKLDCNNYDLDGWFQSEKYFDSTKAKYYFEFKEELIEKIRCQFEKAFRKKTILISIRRGDFVNHPDYFQLPIHFYLNSLIQFFPDWQSRNLIILSDDVNYCKFHFSFLDNAFFGDGLNSVEQLCLGSLCDDFIISNSTFSWWTAWLGEKKGSKIIRPFKNFDGLKSIACDDKDYFPERWTRYNHTETKIKLDDILFCMNLGMNRRIMEDYISSFFDVEIVSDLKKIGEYNKGCVFKKNYILSPVLIYYSCLKSDSLPSQNIIINVKKVFGVSKKLNYFRFLEQKDFGLFSKIFNFSVVSRQNSNNCIYIGKPPFFNDNFIPRLHSESYTIDCYAGCFLKIGGYAYNWVLCKRNWRFKIKKRIKNILK